MTPSCEAQSCSYRICCFYCDYKHCCAEVCGNVEEYEEHGTTPQENQCEAFVDDDEVD